MEEVQQNLATKIMAPSEKVLQEFSFKAKSNPKADFWRKPVEDLKPITLQCQVESSLLKVSNTEGPALWPDKEGGCQKIHGMTKNSLLRCDGTSPAMKAVSKKFKPRKYLVHA